MTDKAQGAAAWPNKCIEELAIDALWNIANYRIDIGPQMTAQSMRFTAADALTMISEARAALKAQPVPTEAQGDAGITASVVLRQMQDENSVLVKSPENAPKTAETRMDTGFCGAGQIAAQGEDSARLEASDLATIEEATKVLESAAKHNSLMGRTVFAGVQKDRAARLRAIIDRARASAETGGVKS